MSRYSDFKILVVDDEPEYRDVLENIFTMNGYKVETAQSGETALNMLEENSYNALVTDLLMDGMDGIELLERVKKKYPDLGVLIVTGYGTVRNAVDAMRKGAFGYFVKSHDPEELIMEIRKIEKISNLEKDNAILKIQQNNPSCLVESRNSRFNSVLEVARKVSGNDTNVLILGESGVGKEVVARYIHQCRGNGNSPFVSINCSSFPESLVEAELFGYEKGAFTGATESREGRFESARGGVLFVDEIGDIPLKIQVKLLRSIENREIQRIGSNKTVKTDFKLISATNINMQEAISRGNFREDLFYRIGTIIIEIPPLRERKEDIEDLLWFFIHKAEINLDRKIKRIEPDLTEFLYQYQYPGNLREMRNLVERMVVLSDNGVLGVDDLPDYCIDGRYAAPVKTKPDNASQEIRSLREIRREAESEYIKKVLSLCGNNISEASRKLQLSRRQLTNKINEYFL